MPLGLMPASSYEEKEIVLDAGESVLFYSDGLVEAHDPEGQMFSFPRLRALVAEHTEERALGEYLLEKLYSFVGGWVGAGGRHHPPCATAFRIPKLNFLEREKKKGRSLAAPALRVPASLERYFWGAGGVSGLVVRKADKMNMSPPCQHSPC
jgi:Stage II sporulation protein E (SpoIIE)